MDKENTSQLGLLVRSRTVGPLSAPIGKAFQSSSQLPGGATPRRALGDVNTRDVLPGAIRKGLGKLDKIALLEHLDSRKPTMLKPPAPASKPNRLNKEKSNMKQKPVKTSAACKPEVNKATIPDDVDEIEFMDNREEPDDFNDIWPINQRPSTYMEEFRDMRPLLLAPCRHVEEENIFSSDDEYEVKESVLLSSFGELHMEPEKEICLEDLMLPPLEDLYEQNSDLFSSLS